MSSLYSWEAVRILIVMISGAVANKTVKGFPASRFLNYAFNNRLRLYSHPDDLYPCPGNPGFRLIELKSDELVQISDPDGGWQFEKWDEGMYQLIMSPTNT